MDAIGTFDNQLEPNTNSGSSAKHRAGRSQKEYKDRESGGKSDRVQFRQMMQDPSTRKWVLLVFWALDRFTSCSFGTPGCL